MSTEEPPIADVGAPQRSAMTPGARARVFHERNPQVMERLRGMALGLRRSGVTRWGMKGLWEVLRYEQQIQVDPDATPFTLNNDYTAWYARELMDLEPELRGFFELRGRRRDYDAPALVHHPTWAEVRPTFTTTADDEE